MSNPLRAASSGLGGEQTLRTIYFYGAAGGALTFLDPVKGSTITKIPTVGNKDSVALRYAIAFTDTPAKREFCNVVIGSEGSYHDIQLIPKSDADNLTSDLSDIDLTSLGDVEVKENSDLSGVACASGLTVGMFGYEDGEPEVGIPEGRVVFMTSIPSGDQATALAVTNIAQPKATKPFSVNSVYYVKGVTVIPEDKCVQAIILKNSEGQCACGPAKGRIQFPSCPCIIDGNDSPAVLAQVQAATEVTAIWEMIEVPKETAAVGAGTQIRSGLSLGGSMAGNASVGGGAKFGLVGGFR